MLTCPAELDLARARWQATPQLRASTVRKSMPPNEWFGEDPFWASRIYPLYSALPHHGLSGLIQGLNPGVLPWCLAFAVSPSRRAAHRSANRGDREVPLLRPDLPFARSSLMEKAF